MKTFIQIICILLCVIPLGVQSQNKGDSDVINSEKIQIQFIANCGYLIEYQGVKIGIDVLFKDQEDQWLYPDAETDKLIRSAKAPFNDIDYVFITHNHGDHFEASIVFDFLVSSPGSKLICPKQVQEVLKSELSNYAKIHDQIIELTAEVNNVKSIELFDIQVETCGLWHGSEFSRNDHTIENNGYLISINDIKLLHTGDAWFASVTEIQPLPFSELSIDLAILGFGFADEENQKHTHELFSATHYVFMHYPKEHIGFQKEILLQGILKNSHTYFDKPLEERTLILKQ